MEKDMPDEPKAREPKGHQSKGIPLTEEDHLLLDSVDGFYADGLALKKWWEEADASDGYTDSFEVIHTLNRPESSRGFFGEAPLDRGTMPVMGVVDEVLYDRPKIADPWAEAAALWTRDQMREFVLHYFMRVSDYRQPEKVVGIHYDDRILPEVKRNRPHIDVGCRRHALQRERERGARGQDAGQALLDDRAHAAVRALALCPGRARSPGQCAAHSQQQRCCVDARRCRAPD